MSLNIEEINELALTSAKYYIENNMNKYSNNSNGQALLTSDLLFNYVSAKKLIEKSLLSISRGKFEEDKLESSKKTLISAIESSLDNPVAIINNYYAKVLVDSLDVGEKIEKIKSVSKDDIITVAKKISVNTLFLLEATNEENND